jgi:hypothetical protein
MLFRIMLQSEVPGKITRHQNAVAAIQPMCRRLARAAAQPRAGESHKMLTIPAGAAHQ